MIANYDLKVALHFVHNKERKLNIARKFVQCDQCELQDFR